MNFCLNKQEIAKCKIFNFKEYLYGSVATVNGSWAKVAPLWYKR